MLIGVLADTHGLLRPEVFSILRGVDLILHAGDIGPAGLLVELEAIAPVQAVFGNVDGFPLRERLPERLTLRLENVTILMTHVGGRPLEVLRRMPEAGQADVFICGHSHMPFLGQMGGTLFLNPGSAGPRRFRLPVCLGMLQLAKGKARAGIIEFQSSVTPS